MLVQIYEVQDAGEANKLCEVGVDVIGILAGNNDFPRELTAEETRKIIEGLPEEARSSVLTLSNDIEEIKELAKKTEPDILHLVATPPKLSPKSVKNLKRDLNDMEIMQTIPVGGGDTLKLARDYESVVDYLLLDTYKEESGQLGVTGEVHDWDLSREVVEAVDTPVILAGGLGPDNVTEAIKKVRPYGVDSKSKTDKPNSHNKDIDKVKKFVEEAERTAARIS